MKRSQSRILTTHVGSLVRPREVVEILQSKADGQPFTDSARALLGHHVAQAVRMQAACGIDIPSDGEYANCVEHPELVAERILRYARLVGRENVIAGVDCGFAQGLATARVHPSIVWEKFRMLAEGARLASRRLWP